MYFKFEDAGRMMDKIFSLLNQLKKNGVDENRALLYTEFSRFSYFRNNYENVSELKEIVTLKKKIETPHIKVEFCLNSGVVLC